jgi:hypothetical protein
MSTNRNVPLRGIADSTRRESAPPALQNFLTRWCCSASIGAGPGFAFGWSSGGQAWEAGFATPQAGVGCSYSWRVP